MSISECPAISKILVVVDELDRLPLRRYLAGVGIGAVLDELSDRRVVVTQAQTGGYDCIVLGYPPASDTARALIAQIRQARIASPIVCIADRRDEVGRLREALRSRIGAVEAQVG